MDKRRRVGGRRSSRIRSIPSQLKHLLAREEKGAADVVSKRAAQNGTSPDGEVCIKTEPQEAAAGEEQLIEPHIISRCPKAEAGELPTGQDEAQIDSNLSVCIGNKLSSIVKKGLNKLLEGLKTDQESNENVMDIEGISSKLRLALTTEKNAADKQMAGPTKGDEDESSETPEEENVHGGKEDELVCVKQEPEGEVRQAEASSKPFRKTCASKKPYKCSICKRGFTFQTNLIRHKCLQRQSVKCKYCGRTFHDARRWKNHKKFHSEDIHFKCSFCVRHFSTQSLRNAHERMHLGNKIYQCRFCSMAFAYCTTRKLHEQRHAMELPYECNSCGKRFSSRKLCQAHKQTHAKRAPQTSPNDEEPGSICKICGRTFALLKGCVYHERTLAQPFKKEGVAKVFNAMELLLGMKAKGQDWQEGQQKQPEDDGREPKKETDVQAEDASEGASEKKKATPKKKRQAKPVQKEPKKNPAKRSKRQKK